MNYKYAFIFLTSILIGTYSNLLWYDNEYTTSDKEKERLGIDVEFNSKFAVKKEYLSVTLNEVSRSNESYFKEYGVPTNNKQYIASVSLDPKLIHESKRRQLNSILGILTCGILGSLLIGFLTRKTSS